MKPIERLRSRLEVQFGRVDSFQLDRDDFASHHHEIGKTQLAQVEVHLPATKGEQSAIATILSDMDTELTQLESKLTKSRQFKQGMMQVLLAGAIRLPMAEAV